MGQREDGSSGRPARVARVLQRIIPPDLALDTREVDAPVAPFQRAARDVSRGPRARRRGRLGYGARQAGRRRRLVGGRRHPLHASIISRVALRSWRGLPRRPAFLAPRLVFSPVFATQSVWKVSLLAQLRYASELACVRPGPHLFWCWVLGFAGSKIRPYLSPCCISDAQINASIHA